MVEPKTYLDFLQSQNVKFFTGVPDSLLKNFCACVDTNLPAKDHVIGANEGASVGLAIGHHIATGETPLVYLQNSGLGNIVNPLMSLASADVYAIPMVIMIGWRGEPGVKDEPQHVHQGRVTCETLDAMNVPYIILDSDQDKALEQTSEIIKKAQATSQPVAILIRKNLFDKYSYKAEKSSYEFPREDAVIHVASSIEKDAVVVCTTGMLSRELFEYRADNKLGHEKDFLCVGGMGHASQIALGIARNKVDRPVYCFDGDGAMLMHMGSLAISGTSGLSNFTHVVFNNGCHESVGGQPTVAHKVSLSQTALAMGYESADTVSDKAGLDAALAKASSTKGSSLIEVMVAAGHRDDIGRPTTTPVQNKVALMEFVK